MGAAVPEAVVLAGPLRSVGMFLTVGVNTGQEEARVFGREVGRIGIGFSAVTGVLEAAFFLGPGGHAVEVFGLFGAGVGDVEVDADGPAVAAEPGAGVLRVVGPPVAVLADGAAGVRAGPCGRRRRH